MPTSLMEPEERPARRVGDAPKRAIRDGASLLWAFGRPHTLVGTSASVVALWVIAGDAQGGMRGATIPGGLTSFAIHGAFTLVAALAANVYIVGLNQLTDVQIDRVNKPALPIASGALDVRRARWIVAAGALSGLLLAAAQGPVLLATLALAMGIGTVYSAPPLRLKRRPLLAALSIAVVRGVVVNAGVSLHAARVLGAPLVLSSRVLLLIAFVFAFSLAIAIAKDLPDTDGDRRYAVPTFAIVLGQGRALRLAGALFVLALIGMVAAGLVGVPGVNGAVLAAAHAPIAAAFVWAIRRVELQDPGSIRRFYRFVWQVFSAEYVLYPIACLLG